MSYTTFANAPVSSAIWGRTLDGQPIEIYTLRNSNGMEMRLMTYGGIVVSLTAPDRNGEFADVTLGYDTLDEYLKFNPHFGAITGRYANRIGGAQFVLGGKTYVLAKNNGPSSLHGGVKGFDKVIWKAKVVEAVRDPAVELNYLSKDGEEGFPGNLAVKAVHTLTDENELRIDFSATTDAPTVCNLTNHSYFNLAGKGNVLNHTLEINASRFTPTDSTFIPTGELKSVAGTPFDFRQPTAIGARIHNDDPQLKFADGYDINYVIDKPPDKMGLHARAFEPASGRMLEIESTAPGVQFYSSNFLDGSIIGKGGRVYARQSAFCLEPQLFPDSPNKPQFPSAELKPGQIYQKTIIYRFLTK
jgi:aldose 1-epimerase